MSMLDLNDITLIKNHYCPAAEEIKIERQINDMVHRLRHLHHQKQSLYLLNEIDHLKKKLEDIRQYNPGL